MFTVYFQYEGYRHTKWKKMHENEPNHKSKTIVNITVNVWGAGMMTPCMQQNKFKFMQNWIWGWQQKNSFKIIYVILLQLLYYKKCWLLKYIILHTLHLWLLTKKNRKKTEGNSILNFCFKLWILEKVFFSEVKHFTFRPDTFIRQQQIVFIIVVIIVLSI